MEKEAIDLLIQKDPRLKRHRQKLDMMRPGAFCVHRTWGVGQITGYDAAENRLLIDFEDGRSGHAMDPAFCVDKLEVLSPEDILVQARQQPEAVQSMINERPADLVAMILARQPQQSASQVELEAILSRLVGPAKYKKWWSNAKKALARDSRIAIPGKKTEPFVLREVPVRAEDEILDEFFETKAPKKKIILANRLIEMSVEHKDIEEALPNILRELAGCVAETRQLTLGERLYGVWIRNDLARFIHTDVEQLEPTSASLIQSADDLTALASEIPATHYKRFLDLIERTKRDDWDRLVFELLKNSSGKFTSECINFLLDRGYEEELSRTLQRWLVEQNLKASVLSWILKNRNSQKYARMLDGLMTPRLLNAIFFAIDYEALQNASNRRIPLAELLGEDVELIGDLLGTATAETAYDLAQTLMLNQGFEDLSKKSLLARFIKLFPGIQQLVSGDSTEEASEEEGVIVSKESFADRKREYEDLIQVKIPKNKIDIAEARAHGDLRENAEYKMARQEQDILLARKAELEVELNRARTTDFADAPRDRIGIGNVVHLRQQATGEVVTYAILGAWDGDPDQNILSYQTPLARALLAKQVGDEVQVDIDGNVESWSIQGIERWVERQPVVAHS